MNRDIDMGGCTWTTVIGGVAPYFTGSLNGAGYLISGLTIAVSVTGAGSGSSYVGLIGRTEAGSVIENVGFTGNVSGAIDDVVLLGGIDLTLEIGALIGGSRGGIVRQAFVTGDVTGSVSVLSGEGNGAAVQSRGFAGGLIGRSESVVIDSYARGNVDLNVAAANEGVNADTTTTTEGRAAGLLGVGVAGSVTRGYSTGATSLSGSGFTSGGTFAFSTAVANAIAENNAPVTASAVNVDTSGGAVSIFLGTQRLGFTDLTTAEMRSLAAFDPANLNWDIADDCALTQIWSLCAARNDGFPTLSIFTLANRSGDDPSQAPQPILQQVGLMPGQRCSDVDESELNWAGVTGGGWNQSWAEWAVPVTGGPVCVRKLFYDSPRSRWAVRTEGD